MLIINKIKIIKRYNNFIYDVADPKLNPLIVIVAPPEVGEFVGNNGFAFQIK